MNKNQINLFFTCDDNYIPFLAVSIESIVAFSSPENFYNIRILHANNISKINQDIVSKEYTKDNISIDFVDITNEILSFGDSLFVRDYYSKTTYYRLLIPTLYPKLDKGLYLDSDIVVLDDIAKLYNIDLGENYVGGIPDESVGLIKEFQDYVQNRIGTNDYREYFNAGILPMNLKKLREIHFKEYFIELLDRVKFDVAQDQDYLNTICKGNVKFIDLCWNKMPISKNGMKDSDIKLIHYNLSFKPWHMDNVLYEEYFWKYADKTVFKDKIYEIKNNYDTSLQEIANFQTQNLIEMCRQQAKDTIKNNEIKNIVLELKNKYVK